MPPFIPLSSTATRDRQTLLARMRAGELDAALIAVSQIKPTNLVEYLRLVAEADPITPIIFNMCCDTFDLLHKKLSSDDRIALFQQALREREIRQKLDPVGPVNTI